MKRIITTSIILLISTACNPLKKIDRLSREECTKTISRLLKIPDFDSIMICEIKEELHKKPRFNNNMDIPPWSSFSKSMTLDTSHLPIILKALTSKKNNEYTLECFHPSHSMIFYKNQQPVGHLWFSTQCRVYIMYQPGNKNEDVFPDTHQIKKLLDANEMTYFLYE